MTSNRHSSKINFDASDLDELLSGYLDGELGADERAWVEAELAADMRLADKLSELRSLSNSLRAIWQPELSKQTGADQAGAKRTQPQEVTALGGNSLGSNFASRVIAAARQEALAAGLSPQHHVLQGESQATPVAMPVETLPAETQAASSPASWKAVAAVLAMAASLVCAAWLPTALNWPEPSGQTALVADKLEPQKLAEAGQAGEIESSPFAVPSDQDALAASGTADSDSAAVEAAPEEATAAEQLVGDMHAAITYTLILDCSITADALSAGLPNQLLAQYGIRLEDAVVIDAQMSDLLAESSMLSEGATTDDALLYVVQADLPALAGTIERIWSDLDRFPKARMDIAFDTPMNKLMSSILAAGAGESNELGVAIPLRNFDAETGGPSPVANIAQRGQLASRAQRSQAANQLSAMLGSGRSTCLLILRLPSE